MKSIILFLFLFFLLVSVAMAEVTPFVYHIGEIQVKENGRAIVLSGSSSVKVSILPGGKSWPVLSLDETGQIYAGNRVIDRNTGNSTIYHDATLILPFGIEIKELGNGFQFRRTRIMCFLSLTQLGLEKKRSALIAMKNLNIIFSSTPNGLLALVTQFGADGNVANHLVEKIDVDRCQVISKKNLGTPDLLIELNHSVNGGWWITGSIEQTLLQSSDGRRWRKVQLPDDLSSLISAYIVSPHEIWLAAILPPYEASPYLLVYSSDGGITWRNVLLNDPILQRMPVGWLEGQKRRVLH